MGRKNLYTVLNELDFNVLKEISRLHSIILEKEICFPKRSISFKEYVDTFYFLQLPFRGTANSFDELLDDLGIDFLSDDEETLFLFAELLLGLNPHSFDVFEGYEIEQRTAVSIYNHICSNIKEICRRTNHKIVKSDGHLIIDENNKRTTLAVELTDDPDLALSLIEYTHYAKKGHLEEKRKILSQIGLYIEPWLKDHRLQIAGYKALESDAGFLLNKFHIRHNNKEGQNAQEYIRTINEKDLEDWYDKAYNVLLSVIIINEQINISGEIRELKKNYQWKD